MGHYVLKCTGHNPLPINTTVDGEGWREVGHFKVSLYTTGLIGYWISNRMEFVAGD